MIKNLKVKKKTISLSILGLLIFFFCIYAADLTGDSLKDEDVSTNLFPNYTIHDPILIEYSTNFTDYGFYGSGSSGDPYLIANLSITNGVDYSIMIINVDDYFIIENCYTANSLHGITMYNVATGPIIRNNTCIDHTFGINLEYTPQSQIINNTISDSDWAISIDFCSDSIIQNNTCSNNFMGIHSFAGGSVEIINNTLTDNLAGMYVFYVDLATIVNNTLTNNGLFLDLNSASDYTTLTFTDNTINSKPIGIFFNQYNQLIDASLYGQIIVINSSMIGISDPSLTPTPIYGVHLYFSDRCQVSNVEIKNNLYCIWVYYTPDTDISEVTCSNDYYALSDINKDGSGVSFRYSNDSTLFDSTLENIGYGVIIFRSFNVDVQGCTCDYNEVGIYAYSQTCIIMENSVNNNFEGIVAMGSGTLTVTDIEIISNTITNNQLYGIDMYFYTANIIIHHNILIDNAIGGTSQAYDDGTNNIWYDTSTNEGNYWSDYSGSGSYSIDGSAGSIDPYPLSSVSEFSFVSLLLFVVVSLSIAIVPLIKRK